MTPSATFSADGVYLALDTSGSVGHVAVGRAFDVLASARLEVSGRQAAELVPAVDRVLDEAGLTLRELSGIVVGEGPGSFTGVRVAAATAKGLARGAGLPLWGVSSLAAAAVAGGGSGVRYVLFDARAERVYAGCWSVGVVGVECLVEPRADELRPLLAGDVPTGAVFVGEGAVRHEALIRATGFDVHPPPAGVPSGEALLRYQAATPDSRSLAGVETWEPAYLKRSSAEREWIA